MSARHSLTFGLRLGRRVVADEVGNIVETEEEERRKKHGGQPGTAEAPPDFLVEKKIDRLPPNRNHEVLGKRDDRGADAAEEAVQLPSAALEERAEPGHDRAEDRVEDDGRAEADLRLALH